MHGADFFYQALVYLTAAVVSVPIAKRLGLGSVLGYLLAGIAIGPFALGLVGEEGQDVLHFAEFGVVLMLFLIGLELEPSRVWRLRGPILGLGGLQVGVTTGALAAIGYGARSRLARGARGRRDSGAVVDRHRSADPEGEGPAGDARWAELVRGAPVPGHRGHPDPRAAAAAGGSREPERMSRRDAEHAHTWVAGLPGWAETLVVLAAVLFIILAGRFLLQPVFRAIARTGCGSSSRPRRSCW